MEIVSIEKKTFEMMEGTEKVSIFQFSLNRD